jgi:amidase
VGVPGLKPSAGPLAHSLEDMTLFMSSILNAEPNRYDVTAHAGPWQKSDLSQAALTIAVLPEDDHFPLHPPVRRALESAVSALQAAGHRIIRLSNDPDRNISYGNRLAFQYFIYGPHVDNIARSGEPAVTSVAKNSHPMFTGPFPVPQEQETFEKINNLHIARTKYQDAWRRAWVDNAVDVILAPGAQNTAVPHDTYGWPPYTLIWNLLDVSGIRLSLYCRSN